MRKDGHTVEILVEDVIALCPVDNLAFQRSNEETTAGKGLREIDGSDRYKAVVEVSVRRRDFFAEALEGLASEGEGNEIILDLLVCRHKEELYMFPNGREKSGFVERHQGCACC